MTRVEVTDEMVERFRRELGDNKWIKKWANREAIRAGLQAALNPPAELEIPVSEAMIDAARKAANECNWESDEHQRQWRRDIAAIYRAMEAKRREEECARPLSPMDHRHCRADDRPNGAPRWFPHRRKGDPA